MFSDETHESLGSCLELDLSIGTILTINGAVRVKYTSDERARNHLYFRSKVFQFLQSERHSPRMQNRCDFLGVPVKIHSVFAMPVTTRKFKIESLQKKTSDMPKKVFLIVYFVPGYRNQDRTFSS